jgi:hypothetical protein
MHAGNCEMEHRYNWHIPQTNKIGVYHSRISF